MFTWEDFVLSHGLLFVTGLSFLFSGYLLLSNAVHLDRALLAFALLFGSGAWLSHSEVSGIHTPYTGHGIYELILYTPAVPMFGALLLHYAFAFPEPVHLVRRFPGFLYLNYTFALILIFLSPCHTRRQNYMLPF